LWFATKGYPVLPLHSITESNTCTCGKSGCQSPGKHPYAEFTPHGVKDAITDVDTVRAWFDERYWLNYGVATDALLVIDVDVKHNGLETWQSMYMQPTRALPHTWTARTGSGGLHVLFDNTEAKIRNGELDKGVDLRGIGGYIVGPYSKHVSGGTYKWLPQSAPGEAPLAAPPEWLLSVIKNRTHCGRSRSIQEWRSIAKERVTDGARHKTFLQFAGLLIANPLLDPYIARELLLAWNEVRCDPPLGTQDCLTMIENLAERELAKDKWL
jgi:hypothetical protein